MMRKWRLAGFACLAAIVTNSGQAKAQVPAAAAPTAIASGPGATAVAAGAEAKPGFFKRLCDTLEECKRKICKTPAGAMINNMTKPLTFATGGIIPPFCPVFPSAADLAQQGVAGAAAAGKKDALEAAARRDGVRYLGTLDCRYFPDAAKALAAALRTDSSECVRYEAALVLNRGCCCTQLTIDALEASVSGTEVDGNPAERSGRVRCAAAIALEKCLSCYVYPAKEPEEKEKDKLETKPGEAAPKPMPEMAKMHPGSRLPSPETVERARKTLQTFNEMLAFQRAPSQTGIQQASATMVLPAGQQSLFHILKATEESGETLKAPAKPTAYVQAPTVRTPAVVLDSTVKTAQAISEVPMVMPTPAVVPAPVAKPEVEVVAPMMVMPPQLDTEPKSMPSIKMPEIKVTEVKMPEIQKVEVRKPEVKMPEVKAPAVVTVPKLTMPEVKVPEVKMPEVKAPEIVTIPEVKMPEETKELAGKVIAIVPVKAVEAPKPAATTTVAPSDKANEAVVELAKAVTQSKVASDRHAAIRKIVKFNWQKHPMVASALILAATNDKEPAVRVDCMRHMVAFKVTHPQVIEGVAALCNDSDVWVRQEAVQTLSLLNAMK